MNSKWKKEYAKIFLALCLRVFATCFYFFLFLPEIQITSHDVTKLDDEIIWLNWELFEICINFTKHCRLLGRANAQRCWKHESPPPVLQRFNTKTSKNKFPIFTRKNQNQKTRTCIFWLNYKIYFSRFSYFFATLFSKSRETNIVVFTFLNIFLLLILSHKNWKMDSEEREHILDSTAKLKVKRGSKYIPLTKKGAKARKFGSKRKPAINSFGDFPIFGRYSMFILILQEFICLPQCANTTSMIYGGESSRNLGGAFQNPVSLPI